MTPYEISYKNLPREEADAQALRDIVDYLGQDRFDKLVADLKGLNLNEVNFVLAFVGISGYPFHAFCRKYHLAEYREWMHGGDDPVYTDEAGFELVLPLPPAALPQTPDLVTVQRLERENSPIDVHYVDYSLAPIEPVKCRPLDTRC